jgi:hypothetical protein
MRRTPPYLIALLCALLLASACGGDDDTAETADTTTTTAPTTTTEAAGEDPEPEPEPEPEREEPPRAAESPEALADQIVEAETAIRAEGTSEADLAWYGHVQQVAYRQLAAHPDWDATVLDGVPEQLRSTVEANTRAGRELRALVRTPRETMPAWRIVEARPAEELMRHYREAEEEFGVPWPYLAAVNLTETRMGRLRGISTANAQGPMQFLPSTWDAYGMGGDINDDRDAIRGAANYLRANGAPDRMDNALYRYNPTDKYVTAVNLYAGEMIADEKAFLGYYHWQVYYWTTLGDAWLPVGWERTESAPVTPDDIR